MLKRFPLNNIGRDFVVGDIHGAFSKLECALQEIQFNEAKDRLFSVGDLVDRGEESHLVANWLLKPWFFPVRGNHDDFAIQHIRKGPLETANYTKNGGAWFLDLPKDEQEAIVSALERLPLVMEVSTTSGLVGIVHADSPYENWSQLINEIDSATTGKQKEFLSSWLLWSRERYESGYTGQIEGINKLVVGHTQVEKPITLGNVVYIDTRGFQPAGHFTLLQIQ